VDRAVNSVRLRQWLALALLWSLSASVPAFRLGSGWMAQDRGIARAPGIAWLSLPVELVHPDNTMQGWARLASLRPASAMADKDPEPPAWIDPPLPAFAEPPPFRIQVHGHVGEGDSILYCFFDTLQRRWFRLAAGEEDPGAGIALTRPSGDAAPRIIDLTDGRLYSLTSGRSAGPPASP
jgi:hypothetical protein